MSLTVVFLAFLALGAAVPKLPKQYAADQSLLQKQQDIIYLLDNLIGEIPNDHLREIGYTYDIKSNLQAYENPNLVRYLWTAVQTGNVQPKATVFSPTVSALRQEFVLLTRIFLGAKDYTTFLNTAAWARIHLNEGQFVKAFTIAVLQRPDTEGVILPPSYEILPQYYFDTRVIQEVQNYKTRGVKPVTGEQLIYLPINYTSHLPGGEHRLSYYTEDIGLNNYYEYLQHAAHMLPELTVGSGVHGQNTYENDNYIGNGARWYYLHQQLLAHYNLERLGNGLGPIDELDYTNLNVPFKSHLSYINGLEFSGRSNGPIDISSIRHELYNYVRTLEKRLFDAIDSGNVITAQGAFLSLYQPQGYNILGDLIQGTGRSINPRYYGSFLEASKVLLSGTPEYDNIWEYTPAALELSSTSLRDPAFYMLLKRIIKLFQHYQESLPAYQYNDVVLPGVQIEKVDISQLVTYFQDYIVNLNNAALVGVYEKEQKEQQTGGLDIKGLLKRLDHQPYEYNVVVQSRKVIPNAVIRLYLGPKYDYEGLPIDINTHRLAFVELDQFVYDLSEGQNIINRNSRQSSVQSMDLPSVDTILSHVENAAHAQSPHYVIKPQQIYGFPTRLSLPKGTYGGYPLQLLVVISAGQQPMHYGPMIPDYVNSYHSHVYQPVGVNEYEQIMQQPAKIGESYTMFEVVPDEEELGYGINQGKWHWTDLYNKYHGYYTQPQWSHIHAGHVGYKYPTVEGFHGYRGQGISEGQGVKTGGYYPQELNREHGVGGGYGTTYEGGKYRSIYQNHIHSDSDTEGITRGQTYEQGVHEQGTYKQEGVVGQGQAYGRGYGVTGYTTGVPTQTSNDEYLHKYHQKLHISELIGGAISLDGKPLGWPLDRQLGVSVWSAPNIYVTDVYVYHHDVPVTHVAESHH